MAPAAFLTIRGTTNSKARITGIDGNAVVLNNLANGGLTLYNVVIAQTGTVGVGVFWKRRNGQCARLCGYFQ